MHRMIIVPGNLQGPCPVEGQIVLGKNRCIGFIAAFLLILIFLRIRKDILRTVRQSDDHIAAFAIQRRRTAACNIDAAKHQPDHIILLSVHNDLSVF